MVGFSPRIGPAVRLLLLLMIAGIVPRAAFAAPVVSTTSAVPMTQFFVVQPVDVCTDAGTSCAYINNSFQTVLSSPATCTLSYPSGNISVGCARLRIGFADSTGMLAHRNIWSALGIDFRQTAVVQYNSTASQNLAVGTCGGVAVCPFSTLIQQPDIANNAPGTPTFPRNPSRTTMNVFFVKNICSSSDSTCTTATPKGDLDGFGALNGNGMAIATLAFLPTSSGRPDTFAHEPGHNFFLNHDNYGAGSTALDGKGLNNLMTSGSVRTVPGPTVTSLSTPYAQWVLQVSPNSPTQANPNPLDLLTPEKTGLGDGTQQGQALLSGLLNATPASSTLVCPVGGCGDAAVQTAAAQTAAAQTAAAQTAAARPSASAGADFNIYAGYSDACFNSPICANASLAEVVIVLTEGKFDNSSGKSFNIVYQCGGGSCYTSNPSPVVNGLPAISHGNANDACLGLGPTTWCLGLKFVPGAITVANGGFLEFRIGTKPADISQLAGTVCYFWESAPGVPYYSSCADLESGFALRSHSQMVNLTIDPLLPLNFAGTGKPPCTGGDPNTGVCPAPTYIDDDFAAKSAQQSDQN